MPRSTRCVVTLVGLLALLLLSGFNSADAASQPKPKAGALNWQLEKPDVLPLFAVGASVLLESSNGPSTELLADGDTGALSTVAAPSNCTPAVGSATQILYTCGGTTGLQEPALYTPASKIWSIPNSTALDQTCHSVGVGNCTAVSLGKYWIEWNAQTCDGGEHCADDLIYQNIATGQVQPSVTDGGGTVWDDPNTQGLAHSICAPLTVPEGFNFEGDEDTYATGSVRFLGRYALLTGYYQGGPGNEIAECGTRFHEKLNTSPDEPALTAGGNVIAWISSEQRISYVDLTDRRQGTWKVPTKIGMPVASVIAGDSLFIEGRYSTWVAKLPRPLG